ncbi:nucleotide exchange factor GrpE [candidate division KSB1 bacterium]|nr:nucleotide exchange factor GrpE [candidate division KSB1 bacterium]
MQEDKKLNPEEAVSNENAAAEVSDSDELVIRTEAAVPESASQAVMEEPENGQTPAAATVSATAADPLAELQNRFLRLAADFANYKRRTENERAEIADWARREMALSLLPILDDFGLMMEYDTQHPERLVEGAKLIRQKMMELLLKRGLEKIEALNQPYDYERHEAVMSQPVQDQALDHVVLSVMQDGYMFKDKVLRPSKVIVGQYEVDAKATVSEKIGQTGENNTEPN